MASPNRRLALLAPGAILLVIVALVVALLLIHHDSGSDNNAAHQRSAATGASPSSSQATEAAKLAASIPAKTTRDWVSFADHVVLAESSGGSLKVSVVYWSRQGAHTLPDLIPGLGPSPAGAYLVPLVWLPDGGGEWAVLGRAVPVKRGTLAPASAATGWLNANWSGKSPQKVAHRLYATKPYPAALPLLGKDVHARVEAVAKAS